VGIGIETPTAGTVLDVDPDNAAGSNSIRFKGSSQATLFHYSSGEHIYLRGGKTTSTVFIGDVRTSNGSSNQKIVVGNAASTTAKLHVSSSDTATVFRVTSNDGEILAATKNQRVGIGTETPLQTLSVSGSAAFSGSFGSTAIETLTSAGALSVTDGVSIIDTTGLANNALYNFTIPNGTFVGQQKVVYGKINAGASGPLSNAFQIGPSSNIDSGIGNVTGQLMLSGTDFGGWQSYPRGGATLLWDGTKWITINFINFFWN